MGRDDALLAMQDHSASQLSEYKERLKAIVTSCHLLASNCIWNKANIKNTIATPVRPASTCK